MRFNTLEVAGFASALHGMRHPMESYAKSDSGYNSEGSFIIGENDMGLAKRLIKNGSEHRKFLRQIMVWVDITAPLYWWKEFDTYKVGTVANSTSTMHKLATTPITLDCFEIDDFDYEIRIDVESDANNSILTTEGMRLYRWVEDHIEDLEWLRLKYIETKDKRYWKELIRWLPESWLQTRTVSMSYENVLHIHNQRSNHKLIEWSGRDKFTSDGFPSSFVTWDKTLLYFEEMCLFVDK